MNPSQTTTPEAFGAAAARLHPFAAGTTKNAVQSIGYGLMLLYIFALLGMLTEVSTELFGFKPYVSILVGPPAILLSLLSGKFLRPLQTKTGIFALLFLGWLILASPFTHWRTGTFETMKDALFKSYSITFMLAAFSTALNDYRRIVHVIAAAGFSLVMVTWFYGGISPMDGRFSLTFGSLMNPNDFAMHLLFVLPFFLCIAATTKHAFTVRPIMIAASLCLLYFALKTASRSALISIVLMALILLTKSTAAQRIMAVVGLLLLAAISAAFLPSTVWDRFQSTFSGEVGQNDVAYGAASRDSRIALLQRSLVVTVTHPVFGVGPGVYDEVEANVAEEQGKRADWLGTHNAYTQVSSEAGIPAAIFLIGAIFAAIRAASRISKRASQHPGQKELAAFGFFLMVTLSGLAVNLFFSHVAYRFYIPILLGLTISLELTAMEIWTHAAKGGQTPRPADPVPAAATLATGTSSNRFRFGGVRRPGSGGSAHRQPRLPG